MLNASCFMQTAVLTQFVGTHWRHSPARELIAAGDAPTGMPSTQGNGTGVLGGSLEHRTSLQLLQMLLTGAVDIFQAIQLDETPNRRRQRHGRTLTKSRKHFKHLVPVCVECRHIGWGGGMGRGSQKVDRTQRLTFLTRPCRPQASTEEHGQQSIGMPVAGVAGSSIHQK